MGFTSDCNKLTSNNIICGRHIIRCVTISGSNLSLFKLLYVHNDTQRKSHTCFYSPQLSFLYLLSPYRIGTGGGRL